MGTQHSDTEGFRQPRVDFVAAAITTALFLIIYGLTVQRTMSFWDCGEFIAAASILGVPHPPGTPLFMLIGRLFSIVPFAADISLRVNMVSVVSGAFAVGMAYLVAARYLRRWCLRNAEFTGKEIIITGGSFCAAVLLGSAATVWSNAVEAEVYGITLFIFMTIMYAALTWVDVRYKPLGPRLLVFASYMAVFGLGVHMMVFLAIPGLWLMVVLFHQDYRKDWRIWAGALATMMVMAAGTEAFLWNLNYLFGLSLWWLLAPDSLKRKFSGWIVPLWATVLYVLFTLTFPIAMFERYGWGTFDWLGTGAIFLASLIGSFYAAGEEQGLSRRRWGLLSGIAGASLVAFTMQLYIPIRSLENPRIDENNPDNWQTFKSFLERKQYGQQSMVTRMFKRRGLWQNQFGRHPRMGFWGFFEEQFVVQGRPFYLLFIIGLLPFVVPFVRSGAAREEDMAHRYGVYVYLLITLLAATMGLVVYMNFADGVFYNATATDQAYLEVRDRDYFFTTGFALFGVCIGIGMAWLAGMAAQRMQRLASGMASGVTAVAGLLLFVALPLGTIQANWFRCDRSANFVPYDYAYNILEGCPPNAILFTNGDNDTFPVWCLQEAYGFRTDVRVVNLSLVNTDWYILQMKNQYGVPMHLRDEQIKTVPDRLDDGRLYAKPMQPYDDRFRGYRHDLVPYMDPDRNLIRVQDQMVEQIALANDWKDPIFFSGSYSGQTMLNLPRHMEMVGQNYRMVREEGDRMLDTAESVRLYDSVYAYRSFADLDSYQDESTASLLWAYPEKMLQVADRYLQAGDTATAIRLAEKARETLPAYWRGHHYLVQLYGRMGRGEDSARVVDEGLAALEHLHKVNPGNVLYVQSYALVLDAAGRNADALTFLTEEFRRRPKEELIFVTLAQFAMRANDQPRLELAARLWLDGHPTDARARQLLSLGTQGVPPPVPTPVPTPTPTSTSAPTPTPVGP